MPLIGLNLWWISATPFRSLLTKDGFCFCFLCPTLPHTPHQAKVHSPVVCLPPLPPVPTCLPEGRVLLKALRVLRVPLPRPSIKQVEGTYLDLPPLFLSLHSALTTKILTFSGFFPFPFLFLFLFSLFFFLCRSLFPFAVHLLFLRVCSHPSSTASSSQLCCHINVTPALPLSLSL